MVIRTILRNIFLVNVDFQKQNLFHLHADVNLTNIFTTVFTRQVREGPCRCEFPQYCDSQK